MNNRSTTYALTQPVSGSRSPGHIRKGLIFIPDISGYTDLVHTTDVITGRSITYELLTAILDHNTLHMEVSEIEGDAILFYRWGDAPSVCNLANQFRQMQEAFNKKLEEIQERYHFELSLSLKIIAHYGPMAEFNIGGFKKLYGEVVIEAHRLLKNSVPSNSYLLITDELMEAAGPISGEGIPKRHVRVEKLFELYGGLRNIGFTWFDFQESEVQELSVAV